MYASTRISIIRGSPFLIKTENAADRWCVRVRLGRDPQESSVILTGGQLVETLCRAFEHRNSRQKGVLWVDKLAFFLVE
jgi:hypothetical protein